MSAARIVRVVTERGREIHIERPGEPTSVLDAATCREVSRRLRDQGWFAEALDAYRAALWIEDAP